MIVVSTLLFCYWLGFKLNSRRAHIVALIAHLSILMRDTLIVKCVIPTMNTKSGFGPITHRALKLEVYYRVKFRIQRLQISLRRCSTINRRQLCAVYHLITQMNHSAINNLATQQSIGDNDNTLF